MPVPEEIKSTWIFILDDKRQRFFNTSLADRAKAFLDTIPDRNFSDPQNKIDTLKMMYQDCKKRGVANNYFYERIRVEIGKLIKEAQPNYSVEELGNSFSNM